MNDITHTTHRRHRVFALVLLLCAGLTLLTFALPARGASPALLVKDIRTSPNPIYPSHPTYLTTVGNLIYYTATDDRYGREFWQTDGTLAGTRIVKDLLPGPASSGPRELTNLNGTLFFVTKGVSSQLDELWKLDVATGTLTLVMDRAIIGGLVPGDDTLFFALGMAPHAPPPGLWKSDGTPTGTYPARLGRRGVRGGHPASLPSRSPCFLGCSAPAPPAGGTTQRVPGRFPRPLRQRKPAASKSPVVMPICRP